MRPSYFDPATKPDTETQYRQGGKVNKMHKLSVAKKMPRKFGEGGVANPTDKITPEMRAKMKAEADAAMNKFYDDKNRLNPVKKAKGGTVKKVRKFAGGGETSSEDKDVSAPHRFMEKDPDIYARARKFVDSDKKASASTYKASPKKVSTVKAEAKPAPAKSSDYGNESRRMTEAPKRAGATGSYDKEPKAAENKQAADSGTDVTSRLKKAFSNIDFGYLTRPNKALYAKGGTVKESKAMVGKELSFMKKKGAPKSMVKHEMMEAGMKPSRAMKTGGKVAKYAKGGGIERKGKTRGKMC